MAKDFNEEGLPYGRSRRKGAEENTAVSDQFPESQPAVQIGDATGLDRQPVMPPEGSRKGNGKAWKKKKHGRGFLIARRLIVLAVLEVFVLFGIFAYAYVLKQYNKIQRPEFEAKNVENKDVSEAELNRMKGYWTIAAFGVDSRDNSVGRGNNSDVIMVVSINQDTGEVKIVSVFRDTYLTIGNGQYSKINQAYAIGGPELAVKALNQNLDLNITDYITFNWKAVATGINILGGVDVDLSKAEYFYINSYITETVKVTNIGSTQLTHAGMNHLDGIQAVAYARLRYMDSDYARTERQRKVISLAYEKAKKASPETLSGLAGVMLSMVATNLNWQDAVNLATNASHYHIGDTSGFPFARGESVMGKRGACIIPQTLESNVRDLHKFLFGDSDYEPSNLIATIGGKISSDTGMYKEGNYIDHVDTDKGYLPKGSKRATDAEEGNATEPATKKATREVPTYTDSEGKTYVLETDAEGKEIKVYQSSGAVKKETDKYGNIINIPENDESGSGTAKDASKSSTGTAAPGATVPAETVKGGGSAGPGVITRAATTAATTAETAGPGAAKKPATVTAGETSAAEKPKEATSASEAGPGGGGVQTAEAVPQ